MYLICFGTLKNTVESNYRSNKKNGKESIKKPGCFTHLFLYRIVSIVTVNEFSLVCICKGGKKLMTITAFSLF